ncbi:MAG: hypothetical protein AB7V04_03915 [Desulfomonilaceae bacterium]
MSVKIMDSSIVSSTWNFGDGSSGYGELFWLLRYRQVGYGCNFTLHKGPIEVPKKAFFTLENKENLGANAIFGVSKAAVKATVIFFYIHIYRSNIKAINLKKSRPNIGKRHPFGSPLKPQIADLGSK